MSSAESAVTARAARPWVNFLWVVGGRALRAGVSMIVGVWVARYLGPTDFGWLNGALGIVLLLFAATSLGLDSLVRQELVREPAEAGAIVGTCMALRLSAGAGVYGVLAALSVTQTPTLQTLWLLTGLMLLTHVPLTLDLWFQARLQLRPSTVAQNTSFVLCSLLRVALILTGAPVAWFAAAIVIEGPLSALLLWGSRRSLTTGALGLRFDRARAHRWLPHCGPLLVAGLVAVAFIQVNQVLLLSLSSAAEAGRFAAGVRLFELGSFVLAALVMTQVPALTAHRGGTTEAGAEAVRGALHAGAAVSWLLALVFSLGAPTIVAVLYGDAYRGTEPVLRILAFALVPFGSGLIRQEVWVLENRTRRLLTSSLVGAGLNVALAFALIPRWGATGAAAAMLVAFLVAHAGMTLCWRDTRPLGLWQWEAWVLRKYWRRG